MKPHSLKKSVILFASAMTIFASFQTYAGGPGSDGGGGNAEANAKSVLQRLILDDGYKLKASMINYLNTISINKVTDPMVKVTLARIGKTALINDINQSHYRIKAGANEAFIPTLGDKSGVKMQPAAATDFMPVADVRFDLDLLFNEVKNLPQEDKMIAVASLAFHEHIHHFQTPPHPRADIKAQLKERETEAYQTSGYVLKTAKFAEVQLLKWDESAVQATGNDSAQSAPLSTDAAKVVGNILLKAERLGDRTVQVGTSATSNRTTLSVGNLTCTLQYNSDNIADCSIYGLLSEAATNRIYMLLIESGNNAVEYGGSCDSSIAEIGNLYCIHFRYPGQTDFCALKP